MILKRDGGDVGLPVKVGQYPPIPRYSALSTKPLGMTGVIIWVIWVRTSARSEKSTSEEPLWRPHEPFDASLGQTP
jgi:hypothetical protein